MSEEVASLHQRLRQLASIAARVAIAVPLLVLVGWAYGIPWLTGVSLRYVTMKPCTAICFLFCAVSLELLVFEAKLTSTRRRTANVCSLLALLGGVVTIVEATTGSNFGFETLLFHDTLLATRIHDPGRMSLAAACGFIVFALSLLTIDFETPRRARPSQLLAFAVVLLALIHLLGYVYAVDDMYRTFRMNSMAIHSAFLFLTLGMGAISARP